MIILVLLFHLYFLRFVYVSNDYFYFLTYMFYIEEVTTSRYSNSFKILFYFTPHVPILKGIAPEWPGNAFYFLEIKSWVCKFFWGSSVRAFCDCTAFEKKGRFESRVFKIQTSLNFLKCLNIFYTKR